MIILDPEDQRQTKDPPVAGLTLRFPEKVVARSDSPLPDYETSEARQKFLLHEASSRRIFDGRLLRAILYALIIYVALSAAIGIPIVLLKRNKNSAGDPPPPTWGDDDPGSSFGLANAGLWSLGNTTGCDWNVTGEDYQQDIFTASAQRSLSSSGSIVIRSNASCDEEDFGSVTGTMTVGMNPNSLETEVILQVNAASSSSKLLSNTGACFNDAGNDRGLFLYSSSDISSTDFLALNISILFPHRKPNATLDNFITYLPGFTQTFGNLTGHVYFNNLVIEGSLGDIVSTALTASKISVKNSFASIRGVYHASASISLDTIKGNLTTDITLTSQSNGAPSTCLTLDTGDGEIDARVTLVAPVTHTFIANVKTFNGPLSLHVAHDPSTKPMPLQLNVQNNLANTNVYLDKKYEGLFNVQTKLDKVTLQQFNATDPLGQGRQRFLVLDQNSTDRVRGWVGWGQRPGPGQSTGGQVKILASLSPVLLQLS